ncbi:MAG: YciI family protein [Bauldia sp.]
MRFMTLVKSPENLRPPPSLFAAIAELGREAGSKMLWMGGLAATQTGTRLRLYDGRIDVKDGPFTEAKEVIGGFAVYEVDSKEEAVEWCRRFLDVHRLHWPEWSGEVEMRVLMDGPPPPRS